jgi:glycosyltransferase involved in cell wall biosynthesis
MRRAAVFAFPSQLESLPNVCIEAMACGVPVAITSRGPGPEIVEDGKTGLLIDPDSPADIADKVTRLLDDRELGERLAAAARQGAQLRYGLDGCVERSIAFYRQCLDGGSSPPTQG